MERRERDLSAEEMATAAQQHRMGLTFLDTDPESGEAIARGWHVNEVLRPGLAVSLTQTRILRDGVSELTTPPAILLGVTLHGGRSVSCAGIEYKTSAGDCAAISMREPVCWKTRQRAGDEATVVGLVLTKDWLATLFDQELCADCAAFRDLANTHLVPKTCRAKPSMRRAAEALILASEDRGLLGRLRLEAAALDYVAAWLDIISGERSGAEMSLGRPGHRRILEVRERLDELRPGESVTLESLAREFGLSTSTLCRHFRRIHGTSVCQYLSEQRLQLAHAGLKRGEVTIAQAAFLAGYSSASSFSTAFKRSFGLPPSVLVNADDRTANEIERRANDLIVAG